MRRGLQDAARFASSPNSATNLAIAAVYDRRLAIGFFVLVSPKGAKYHSPGQRPGSDGLWAPPALKGRDAIFWRVVQVGSASVFRPFRAGRDRCPTLFPGRWPGLWFRAPSGLRTSNCFLALRTLTGPPHETAEHWFRIAFSNSGTPHKAKLAAALRRHLAR